MDAFLQSSSYEMGNVHTKVDQIVHFDDYINNRPFVMLRSISSTFRVVGSPSIFTSRLFSNVAPANASSVAPAAASVAKRVETRVDDVRVSPWKLNLLAAQVRLRVSPPWLLKGPLSENCWRDASDRKHEAEQELYCFFAFLFNGTWHMASIFELTMLSYSINCAQSTPLPP